MERSIYFIRCSLTGATKIGIADDVLKRMRQLQTANPGKLTLLGTVPGNRSVEAAYHKRFAEKRLGGEWFRLTDEDVDSITSSAEFEEIDAVVRKPSDFMLDDNEEPWVRIDRAGMHPMVAFYDGLSLMVNRGQSYLKLEQVIAWHEDENNGSGWDSETLRAARGVLHKFECGDFFTN